MVQPCDEEGRGTHIEKSVGRGNTRKEKNREVKPRVENDVANKAEWRKRLIIRAVLWRPRMMGQAWDKEEQELLLT